jgi:hypothetical protein
MTNWQNLKPDRRIRSGVGFDSSALTPTLSQGEREIFSSACSLDGVKRNPCVVEVMAITRTATYETSPFCFYLRLKSDITFQSVCMSRAKSDQRS